MKKIIYGSIALCLFAFSIIITEISCQKTIGQTSGTSDENNGHFILYAKTNEVKIPVVTQTDTSTITTYITYYVNDYYTSDLEGNNETKIPIMLPGNLYVSGNAKLTSDGSMVVFSVNEKPTEDDANPQQCYIYSCLLNGSNLKKVKENCGFSDVH